MRIKNRFNNKTETVLNIRRILLAEDDDDDFNLLNSAILSISATIDIFRTKNGIMLLSMMETSIRPDLIILDINMPYKDGVRCLKEIRSKRDFDAVKILVYSTSQNQSDMDQCYRLGADFFMVKPDNFDFIIYQFRQLLGNKYPGEKNCAGVKRPFVFNKERD